MIVSSFRAGLLAEHGACERSEMRVCGRAGAGWERIKLIGLTILLRRRA